MPKAFSCKRLKTSSRNMQVTPSPFTVEVSARDTICNLFQACVRVNGSVALRYRYRLNGDLSPCAMGRSAVVSDAKALARIFGRRNLLSTEAEVMMRLFFENEANQLLAEASATHVEAAARAGQFTRISNVLAVEHALILRTYLDGALQRRLMSFELCDEAGAFVPFHWTEASDQSQDILPPCLTNDG